MAKDRDLEIRYTALSYVVPERVLFKYKLEGYDREWVDAQTRRKAFYTNLRPGQYTFRVIACNADGIWNETGAALPIVLGRDTSGRAVAADLEAQPPAAWEALNPALVAWLQPGALINRPGWLSLEQAGWLELATDGEHLWVEAGQY